MSEFPRGYYESDRGKGKEISFNPGDLEKFTGWAQAARRLASEATSIIEELFLAQLSQADLILDNNSQLSFRIINVLTGVNLIEIALLDPMLEWSDQEKTKADRFLAKLKNLKKKIEDILAEMNTHPKKTEQTLNRPTNEQSSELENYQFKTRERREIVKEFVSKFEQELDELEKELSSLFTKRQNLEDLDPQEKRDLQNLIIRAENLKKDFLNQLKDEDFNAVLEALYNILGNLPSGLIDPEEIKLRRSIEDTISPLLAEVESLKNRFDDLGAKLWCSHRDTVDDDLQGVDVPELENTLKRVLQELDDWQNRNLTPEQIIKSKGPKKIIDELEKLVLFSKELESAIEQLKNDANKLLAEEKAKLTKQIYLEKLQKAISSYKGLAEVIFNEKDYFKIVFPEFDDARAGSLVHDINDLKTSIGGMSLSSAEKKIDDFNLRLTRLKQSIDTTARNIGLSNDDLATINNELSNLESETQQLIDTLKQEMDREEKERKLRRILQAVDLEINRLEKGPVVELRLDNDEIGKKVVKLKSLVDQIDQYELSGSLAEKIKKKVWVFIFKYTKKALQNKITSDEIKLTNSGHYIGTGSWWTNVFTGWGFKRMQEMINQVSGVDSQLASEMSLDLGRFQRELSVRKILFFAEQSVEATIFLGPDDGKGPKRTFPGKAPAAFLSTQNIIDIIRPRLPLSSIINRRLIFSGETEMNRKLGQRDVLFVNPETGRAESVSFTVSAHGEAMRVVDLLFSNLLHERIAKKISSERRAPTNEERAFMKKVNELFRSVHLEIDGLHEIVVEGARLLYGTSITPAEARRGIFLSILFINHSMRVPASSPATNDELYKANQALDYAILTALGQKTKAVNDSLFKVWFGLFNPSLASGKDYYLEYLGMIDSSKLAKVKGLSGRFIRALRRIPDINKDTPTRTKLRQIFTNDHELRRYLYLLDVPLILTPNKVWGTKQDGTVVITHPVVPMPLQYMQFTDGSGNRLNWHNGMPVVASDFISTEGDILYELIPWEQLDDKATSLAKWYNTSNNLFNLYNLMFKTGWGLDDLSLVSVTNVKTIIKYAADGFSSLGRQVLSGDKNKTAVIDRLTELYVLGVAIHLVRKGGKPLHEVLGELAKLTTIFDEGFIEAVSTILEVAFGPREEAERSLDSTLDQLQAAFKYE